MNCGLTISVTVWQSYCLAKVTIRHDQNKVQLPATSCYNYYSVKLKKAILQITCDKSFIIPFSLTRETTKCTLLMPQVFTRVCIKILFVLFWFINMGWKFVIVWYDRKASMTTLSAFRYSWRCKLRKIIPTSRPWLWPVSIAIDLMTFPTSAPEENIS